MGSTSPEELGGDGNGRSKAAATRRGTLKLNIDGAFVKETCKLRRSTGSYCDDGSHSYKGDIEQEYNRPLILSSSSRLEACLASEPMDLSKGKGKAIYVAKGKKSMLDGDLEKTVTFLREKNVGVVIRDQRELNQIRMHGISEEKGRLKKDEEEEKEKWKRKREHEEQWVPSRS